MNELSPDPRKGLPSASSMSRTMNCPAWIGRTAALNLAPIPEKKFTADGTLVHAVLSGDEDDEELDDDLDTAVRVCKIHEEKMLISIGFEDYTSIIEQRIFLKDDQGNDVASGQMDRIHISGDKGAVIDFKAGRKDVLEPVMNPQLITGAILAVQEHPELTGVYLGISYAWKPTPAMAYIDRQTIASWRGSILIAIDEAKSQNPSAKAGKWCDYCPVRSECPQCWEIVRQSEKLNLLDMKPEEIAPSFDLAKHADTTIKVFLEQVKARLQTESIPGLQLGKPAQMKSIPGTTHNWMRLTSLYSIESLIPAIKFTPASIAKALSPGKGTAATKKMLEEEFADIIETKDKSASIERV